MSYLIQLRQFEGPLGLLLYLIRKEEMDVFDINVTEITRQYLDYIRLMKELDLEVAGEFVAMAATLIHIKSRMLLPQYNEEGDVVEVEDPRKELVQRLLEYQRYQEVAKSLYERPLLNRDVYARGVREDIRSDDPGEVITEDEGLFSLIGAYRKVMRKAHRGAHKVRSKVQSIAARIFELRDKLRVGSRVMLRELLAVGEAPARVQLLITFLSMLELGRMGFVSVYQNENYGDIYIETKKPIERNVLERVQEFDSGDTEAIAKTIIHDAVEDKIDMAEAMATGQAELPLVGPVIDEEAALEVASEVNDVATDEEIAAAEAEIGSSELSPELAELAEKIGPPEPESDDGSDVNV